MTSAWSHGRGCRWRTVDCLYGVELRMEVAPDGRGRATWHLEVVGDGTVVKRFEGVALSLRGAQREADAAVRDLGPVVEPLKAALVVARALRALCDGWQYAYCPVCHGLLDVATARAARDRKLTMSCSPACTRVRWFNEGRKAS